MPGALLPQVPPPFNPGRFLAGSFALSAPPLPCTDDLGAAGSQVHSWLWRPERWTGRPGGSLRHFSSQGLRPASYWVAWITTFLQSCVLRVAVRTTLFGPGYRAPLL